MALHEQQPIPFYGTVAYESGIRRIAERNLGLQDQVADNANTAFKDLREPALVVAKVVGMHEEQRYIYRSLEAFHESNPPEYPMVLSCNAPIGTAQRDYDATMDEVQRFKRDHPEFPLSYYETRYPDRTTIGEIRNHDVGVAIGSLVNKYGFMIPRHVMVVNADADTVSTPRNYLPDISDAAKRQHYPELSFVYPGMLNARSGGAFPNMDAVMAWTDLYALYGEKYPDQHNGMGLGFYLAAHEYDINCSYGETTELLARGRESLGDLLSEVYIGPKDAVVVSARHAYHQMNEGEEPHFGPVRSEATDYRSELTPDEGHDLPFGVAYQQIEMLRMAELPNVVEAQAAHFVEQGLDAQTARMRAIDMARLLIARSAPPGTPPQIIGAAYTQLDRMQAQTKGKVA